MEWLGSAVDNSAAKVTKAKMKSGTCTTTTENAKQIHMAKDNTRMHTYT